MVLILQKFKMKEIKIGRFIIKDLRPIRSNFINVNGNFSAYGFIKKRKVKVYSPNDENQINLRLKISNSNLSKYFPKLITFDKNFIVEKGSVAINGISLTIAKQDNNNFSISVIPHTYDNTNLKYLKIQDLVNIEFDYLARFSMKDKL